MNKLSEHENKISNCLTSSAVFERSHFKYLNIQQVSGISRLLLHLLLLYLVDFMIFEELLHDLLFPLDIWVRRSRLRIIDLFLKLFDGEWGVKEDPFKPLSAQFNRCVNNSELLFEYWSILLKCLRIAELLMNLLFFKLTLEYMHDRSLCILFLFEKKC